MSSNPAGKAFLAVGTIVLCGLSAWFGATFAQTSAQAPGIANGNGSAGELKDVLERLDEMERAMMNFERKLEVTTDNARAALDLANDHATRQAIAATAATGHASASPSATAPTIPGAPIKPMTDEEVIADRMARAEEIARRIWPDLVRTEFGVITGTTTDDEQHRRTKGSLEATATTLFLGLKAEGEMKFREVFAEQWAAYHTELTPLVPQGIAKADIASVAATMRSIWARTDARMREILDDDANKRWISYAEGNRARLSSTLDDIAAGK